MSSITTFASNDLVRKLNSYVEENKESVVGLQLALFDSEEILLEAYEGYENKEANKKMSKDTVIEWGSCTKLLIWVSAFQFYEEGLLDLDKDIREYLPDNFLDLSYNEPITMKYLMNHQAGFEESLLGLFLSNEKEVVTLEETLKEMHPKQVFKPGEYTAYSNYGSALAAFIVERVSGMEFWEYVHKNIFNPLNMDNTAILPGLEDNSKVRGKRDEERTYSVNGKVMSDSFSKIPLYPAGMCTGTLSDFVKFGMALLKEDGVDSKLFKEKDSLKKLFEPTSNYNSGAPRNSHGFWAEHYETIVYGHGGNTAGSSSKISLDLKNKIGIAIMTNQSSEKIFCYKLMPVIFGEYKDNPNFISDRKLSDGYFSISRAVFSGPLKLTSMPSYKMEEDDLLNQWEYVEGNKGKVEIGVVDLIKEKDIKFYFVASLIILLLAGCIYGLIGLTIEIIRKFSKKDKVNNFNSWNTLGNISSIILPISVVCMTLATIFFQAAFIIRLFSVINFVVLILMIAAITMLERDILIYKKKRNIR